MAKNDQRHEQDNKIHGQGMALDDEEADVGVDAPRAGDVGGPEGVHGDAADEVHDDDGGVAGDDEGDQDVAQALLEGHDAHARVVQRYRQLEEHVGCYVVDVDSWGDLQKRDIDQNQKRPGFSK